MAQNLAVTEDAAVLADSQHDREITLPNAAIAARMARIIVNRSPYDLSSFRP